MFCYFFLCWTDIAKSGIMMAKFCEFLRARGYQENKGRSKLSLQLDPAHCIQAYYWFFTYHCTLHTGHWILPNNSHYHFCHNYFLFIANKLTITDKVTSLSDSTASLSVCDSCELKSAPPLPPAVPPALASYRSRRTASGKNRLPTASVQQVARNPPNSKKLNCKYGYICVAVVAPKVQFTSLNIIGFGLTVYTINC